MRTASPEPCVRPPPQPWQACLLALVLALACAGAPGPARAGEALVTAVIPVGYGSAARMAEVLRPLVPPPGSVSSIYGKLVVRTTPANLRDLRRVLAKLDRAPVNLLITVRHRMNAQIRRDLLGARARASVGPPRASGQVTVLHAGNDVSDDTVQRVRVLDGQRAFIAAGQEVPVGATELFGSGGAIAAGARIEYRDATSGFYVRPRLVGDDRVRLTILTRRVVPSSGGGGHFDVQRAETTITVALGRWIRLGGIDRGSASSASGEDYTTRAVSGLDQPIYLKVQALR